MITRENGIVFFSAQDYWYHNRAHSDFQLTKGIARSRRVVLVNSIGMRMPTASGSTQPLRRILRKAASIAKTVRRPEAGLPDLYVMSPVILPMYGSARGRALNARIVSVQVGLLSRALGLRRPAAIVTIPTAVDVVKRLRLASVTVNRSDKFSAFPETDQDMIAGLERELLQDADAVAYVSHQLMADERALVGGTAIFLGHGVDVDHFVRRPHEEWPDDLAHVQRPIVGFFGGLDDYVVDFDLIVKLADSMTEGTVLLIGDATCDISALTSHPRVSWLGARPYADIPAYGSAFDVAIMPWLDNDWIRYCNPIKVKEYLALGLPVVTTYYPEAEQLERVIDIGRGPDDFVALVSKVLESGGTGSPEERRRSVAGDTWQSRSDALLNLIDTVSH